jgi:hypothetical protein
MKKIDLKRLYRYDMEKELYYIDIQLEDYRDAYSSWDYSSLNNRDLDDDLTEYLLECAYELTAKNKIMIDFHILHQDKDDTREERTREGIYNYFNYEIRKLSNQRLRLIRDTFYFFLIGSIFLLAGSIIAHLFTETIVTNLISEGFFIGGWVMIWEMFTTWFFNINKLTHTIKTYRKLRDIPIIFTYAD